MAAATGTAVLDELAAAVDGHAAEATDADTVGGLAPRFTAAPAARRRRPRCCPPPPPTTCSCSYAVAAPPCTGARRRARSTWS